MTGPGEILESEVRYYSRHLPATFVSARGALIHDDRGRRYIDLLSACGSLNYGHNDPRMKRAVVDHLEADGVANTLDLRTPARQAFIADFHDAILRPRGLDHRLQFTGPTGTNAVEAALKLARKVTGRRTIVAFTNAFHGVTLGSLAVTGNGGARAASAALLQGVVRLPFDGYEGAGVEELERYARAVSDPSGGHEPPAAFILETVQGEGGLNVASVEWLRKVAEIAKRLGALLIVDDVQAGCGRAGAFFSFERAGIVPDLICMSKSLSGMGLPMALLLVRPDRDLWAPGEHNGTFRGSNLSFRTASVALDFWRDDAFVAGIAERSRRITHWARGVIAPRASGEIALKGLGLMLGLSFARPGAAEAAARRAFELGVIVETAGPRSEVLKLFPPLTIESEILDEALDAVSVSIAEVLEPAKRRVELVAC